MIVAPTIANAGPLQPIAPITRVSLADLLSGAGGSGGDVQSIIDLLRSSDKVVARVVETRADGVSVVELAKTRVTIRLASPHAPGDVLHILLDEAAAPADMAAAAAKLAPEVKLSAAANLLSDIQNSTKNQIVTQKSAPMAEASATPEALARHLQYAVRTSGLFYESHLRGWVDGQVPLTQIFEEPQARIADTPAATATATDTTQSSATPAAVHPQLEHLVRQQLDTFDRQAIAWRGDVWPNQPAEILIQREPEGKGQPTESGSKSWRIHLATTLPVLGTVVADIALNGRKIDVRLQGEAGALAQLRETRTELAHALAAHHLEVNPIRVAESA